MTWIGTYAAAASLICAAEMTADTLRGVWKKKLWFPSRFFTLNAISLSLLAVAMKLLVDLTTRMYTVTDRLAKISSLAIMSTAVAKLKLLIKKHWVIARTGNPGFVLARSVTCITSGVLTLMIALVLLEAECRMAKEFDFKILDEANSSYFRIVSEWFCKIWNRETLLLFHKAELNVFLRYPQMKELFFDSSASIHHFLDSSTIPYLIYIPYYMIAAVPSHTISPRPTASFFKPRIGILFAFVIYKLTYPVANNGVSAYPFPQNRIFPSVTFIIPPRDMKPSN